MLIVADNREEKKVKRDEKKTEKGALRFISKILLPYFQKKGEENKDGLNLKSSSVFVYESEHLPYGITFDMVEKAIYLAENFGIEAEEQLIDNDQIFCSFTKRYP